MEIIKADWLRHLKDTRKGGGPSSIFTISVDASGRRLASAGLDSTIRIWNLEALGNPNAPKLLAAMTRHDGAVLCLKWSPAGSAVDYLASSADDSVILIWKREEGNSGGAFDFDHDKLGLNPPIESYRPVHRLTDHESDVAGLEWSPDGHYLASCGLDGYILIWDVQAGFKTIAKLEGHNGFVKGLAWDPLGVYLVSQSDDHSMIVWRTKDWQPETQLKKPFDQGNEETFFRRPSWSPDGSFIAAANAVNGHQPVVSLISRDQWKAEVAFVGHLLAVEVARFSPFLYRQRDEATGYLCAAGSQDCNTSFWSDKNERPLAVLTDLFEHAVMDIEWLPDGLSLLIAAYDGTISLVKLDPSLVGNPLIGIEHSKYMAALRKKSETQGMIEQLPTSVAQIRLQTELDALKATSDDHRMNFEPTPSTPSSTVAFQQAHEKQVEPVRTSPTKLLQKETTTKDGKRRITPLVVQSQKPTQTEIPRQATALQATANRPSISSQVKTALKLPSVQKKLSLKHESELLFEAINSKSNGSFPSDTKLVATKNSEILWEERLDSPVVLMESMESLLVLGLMSKVLIVYTTTGGRRIIPPLQMDGSIVGLSCSNGHIVVVTDNGGFKLWSLVDMKLVHDGNLFSIGNGLSLTRLDLLSEDSFIVGFSDGRVYEYLARLGSFVQINGSAFQSLEYDYARENRDTKDDIELIKEGLREGDQGKCSVTVLETRLALAGLRGDTQLFLRHLSSYLRCLVANGLEDRVKEVLMSLAMPRGAFSLLQDFDRRALLRSLSPLLSGLVNADRLLEEVLFSMDHS